jgi:hypothetical protein
MKTSNNQQIIEKMPFYVFNNFMVYYNRITEKENSSSGGEEDKNKFDEMSQKTMRQAKSLVPKSPNLNFKAPKLK